MTNAIGRGIAALLAAFILYALVRAFRRGVIHTRGMSASLDDEPMLFSIIATLHGLAMAMFALIAAGFDQVTFWHWVIGR